MSRRERLERWADLLDAAAPRRLLSLHELEWLPLAKRAALRANGSALSVAFADPMLREAGLPSDRFGDAVSFFDVSEPDMHRLLCSCLNGRYVAAAQLATEVRQLAARGTTNAFAWSRVVPGEVTAGGPPMAL